MKKLLGGIFARSASAESPRAASTSTAAAAEALAPTPKRWGAFLLPSTTAPPTADQVTLTHLDAAMRGIAAHVKAVIARIVDGETYGEELQTLVKFVEVTEQQLQQESCEASLEVLRSYFSSPEGFAFCEQTAFPSLVLDFISKMRAFAMEEELRGMIIVSGDGEHDSGNLKADSAHHGATVLVFGNLVPSLQLFLNCVVAIASSEVLMNTFRCELPNLLALTAEEYPPMALFIRDASTRALISVPEGNFNAGLAWYLLDCNAIAKTIQLLTNYALATVTTPETAARALEMYQNMTSKRSDYGRSDPSIDGGAAAAAVSEALGLSRSIGGMSDEPTAPTLPPDELQGKASDTHGAVPKTLEMFCLPCYDVRVGLKAVIYVLENTYRFTLVLLDEFQTAGGYALLLRLLDSCREEEIPTLLSLLTSLIPLGPRSSDSNESSERFVGGNMLCARNANAFATMRDLLLNYVAEPDGSTEVDKEGAAVIKRRNEHLILLLLTNVLHIYTSDYDNFVFLEPKTRLLALLLTKLPFTAFYDAQVIILRVVEYVCCSARPDDPLPHDILSIICGMLVAYGPFSSQSEIKEQHVDADSSSSSGWPKHLEKWFEEGPGTTLSNLMCECLIKILRTCEAERYKQELSGFGLMDRGIYLWLEQIAICVTSALATDKPALHQLLLVVKPHLEVYGNLLCLMLRENARECIQYRESRIHESLYAIIESVVSGDLLSSPFDPPDDTHLSASRQFPIVTAFVEPAGVLRSVGSRGSEFVSSTTLLQAGVESDLDFILELLQRFREAAWRQVLLLYILMDTLKIGGSMVALSWRGCQGYEIILALLSSIDLTKSDTHDRSFQVMDAVLRIINITLSHNSQSNIEYFKAIHGYSTIASCIITSGTLNGTKKEVILERTLELVTVNNQLPEIRNGDAVQIIFCLLPILPLDDAIDIMKRLLSMLETAGDTSLLRRKEQIDHLIRAGALQWIQEPKLIKIMMQYDNPLRPLLAKWIMSIVLEEDLTIPRLQEFMELAGKMMPTLLESCNTERTPEDNASAVPEIGLILLQSALRNPAIRHISVGKPHGTEQTGRYVHIVNSTDRVWPPPSGYSFSCWLRFPSSTLSSTIPTDPRPATTNDACTVVSVALCEGYLSVTPDAKPEDQMNVYGVLVDTALTLFRSSGCAAQNQESIAELEVSSISRIGPLDWSFASTTERYLARCANADDMDMWWRAITRSGSFVGSNSGLDSDDILFASFNDGATPKPMPIRGMASGTEGGSACIVSIYSLESSGCFVRAFFEQSTGFLRFHTGAVSSGPSMNANPKRTSVVFESVAIDGLRPSVSSNCSSSSAAESDHNGNEIKFSSTNETERKRDWHHFAFTHRKSVVGSSSITVYIDGMELTTKKLNYPSAPSVGSFQAFVGSDAQVCSPHSALSWKAGPMWLTDEVVSSRTIAAIFSLGPTFAHQFSGHSYRSVGDWPEALASSHLARAADRGIAVLHFSQRLQLTRLGRSCRPHWRDWNQSSSGAGSAQSTANDTVATSAALIAESMIAKKDELTEGLRLATGGTSASSRKMKNKVSAFRNFITYDCALSSFGSEIEYLLVNSKLPEDTVLFTLNTSCSDRSNTSVLVNTQAHYINCAQSRHLDMARSLPHIGGIVQVLFPLLENARHQGDFCIILKMLVNVLRRNPACLAECIGLNGYAFITALLCKRVDLINEKALRCVVRLAVAGKLLPYASGTSVEKTLAHPVVVSVAALTQVVLSVELRKKLPHHLQCQLVALLMDLLVVSNPNAVFNARQLRRAGLLQWILTYLSELGNEDCEMNTGTALEMRWCFPKFSEPTFEAILQYDLSLLRAYLRIESHVDDFHGVAEMLLLSMAGTAIHSRGSPIRVLLLQFVLHEIENDLENGSNSETISSAKTPGLSATIIEAILHREDPALVAKKRDDRRVENGNTLETASLGSPIADNSSKLRKGVSSVEGFASILLDVIDQESDGGRWVSTEALLAIRILFTLAQLNVVFAEHLLSKAGLALKLKRALPKYSTDYCAYIPLLAYVFGIPVGETSYCDPDTLSTTDLSSRSFSSPHSLEPPEKGADQVWDLIGDLLQQNCLSTYNSIAVEINVNMIGKIAYQVDQNAAFFADLCKSSATLFRVIVQCLCSSLDRNIRMIDTTSLQTQPSNSVGSTGSVNSPFQELIAMMNENVAEPSNTASSCLHLTQTIMIRALGGNDEFGSLMMLFLETLEEQLLKQEGPRSRFSGQRFWLALLNSVIDKEEALTTKCTLISMKNVCTVCVAIARYLAVDENHLKVTANIDEAIEAPGEDSHFSGVPSVRSEILGLARTTCFGEEVFRFFMNCCKRCAEPTTALCADQQQFFYGTLLYSAQTVLLNELGGTHIETVASPQILDYLVEWKHVLLQQPNWQGLVSCGTLTQSPSCDINQSGGTELNSANITSARPRRLHRVRSLSANAHKEFSLGTESDRCFILSLASVLFKMLMDDEATVRHKAIVMWQFLIDRRFSVLKELLIAEPRTSLLHTITSAKKEAAVDIFHGGFDRLLYALHTTEIDSESEENTNNVRVNQEIWCQFQLWLAENNSLLTDLLVTRTESIYRHIQDVLLSCSSIEMVPSSANAQETLDLNFPVRLDVRKQSSTDPIYDSFDFDSIRREMIAKKAAMKLSSFRDSSLESINDGLSLWQETALRLAYTRNIWRTGRWQTMLSGDHENSAKFELEPQRSLFQRRLHGYRLDTTEGPQRMRLRLIQDCSSDQRSKENPGNQFGSEDTKPTKFTEDSLVISQVSMTSNMGNLENEKFRRGLEFHEAVDVFREFVYRQSIAANGAIADTIEVIMRQCKLDSTRKLFSGIIKSVDNEYANGEEPVLTMARLIYASFLDGKSTMGISPSIVSEIDRCIDSSVGHPEQNPIQSTMFDAADAEATQYALCSVREESIRSIRLDMRVLVDKDVAIGGDGSNDEAEEELPVESGYPVDDGESEDSDGPPEINHTVENEIKVSVQEKVIETEEELGDPIEVSLEPTSPKAEQNKQMDTSSDAVYGAIARFLRVDDYPPRKSYNATYIAGMGGTAGLLTLCRSGLYFIGGYTKLNNDLVAGTEQGVADNLDKPTPVFFHGDGEQDSNQCGRSVSTPTSGRKKTPKTLFRAALTDLGFSQPKPGSEQFFTVVPLAELPAYSQREASSVPSLSKATSFRWSIKYSNIKQFCRIKYQLRPVGIEFFDTFGSTYFLQLENATDREEVVKLLFQMPLINSIFWSPVFRTGSLVPSTKRIRQAVTKRWLRGSISNFEYLIHLNTLAGRSFNDITQYPVFPWVISDYSSGFLDLDARDTFRDLSKPMGAIGKTRAAQFSERYAAMCQDMDTDELLATPAFHYGTHYSCSAYVINYLIRLEPFTAFALELQGGSFDHPDRLFRSVASSWASASRENLQDVRELIPEFFYLPEFLYNANNCSFGATQSGEEVCHVNLPPWAHGDPREFVRLNRRALESKYVSEHLHQWIDLVFGSKQTGQAAVDAQNVFMHFTYEGTVDIDQISDPVMRAATLAQIENFGQTPSRLFSGPHPQRKVPTLLAATPPPVQAVETSSVSMLNPSVGHQYDGITLSTIEAYVKWHTPLAPALVSIGKDYVFLKKHSAVSVMCGGVVGDVKLIHDKMQCQGIGCTFMPPRFAKYLDWGNNGGLMKLRVHQQSTGRYRDGNKVLAIIEGAHHDNVNCVSISDDGSLLVTGGNDAVVNLIECSKTSDGRRIFKQAAKFVGHTDSVVCVAINKDFNLIASSSADRSVLLWDLRTRALLQELAGHAATVAHVSINGATGNVLTTTHSEIRLWSINGDLLAASSSSYFGLQTITCAISTRCESWQTGVIAVTGHANGAIALWGIRYPADLARQKKDLLDTEIATSLQSPSESGVPCTSPSTLKRTDTASMPVSISSSSSARKQVVPSCQLFILKLLLDHRAKVTALTLGPEQRQLLSGDADGNCIRWVDDSISTNIH